MAYERVQKTFGQSSSKKKHTPIVPPLNEELTQAGSQLSPKLKPSRIPSKEERDAIKRKIFDSISRSGENQAMREGLFSPTVREQKTPDSASTIGMPIQAKLTIGEPGDKYEQEADRVAAQVVNRINAPVAQQSHENQEREVLSEADELQMKPTLQLQAGDGGMAAPADLESSIQLARSGGQSLADNIRQPMEQAFGADFSGVKVHTDAQADQLNQAIQAKAFTTGQDVFFRSGEYQPGSRGGQELLAHELTHVVQQSGEGTLHSALQTDLKTLWKAPQTIESSIAKSENATIQRKFSGLNREFYLSFISINFNLLGLEKADECMKFIQELSNTEELIFINQGSRLRYDPITNELLVSSQQIKELVEYGEKRKKGESIKKDEHQAIITTIANLTHELSHARDNVIVKKTTPTAVEGIMYTELKAWGFEAVTAAKLKSRLSGTDGDVLDAEKESLISGWLSVNPQKIEETYDNRSENELTRRFWDYMIRGLRTKDKIELVDYVKTNKEWYVTELTKIKNYVVKTHANLVTH